MYRGSGVQGYWCREVLVYRGRGVLVYGGVKMQWLKTLRELIAGPRGFIWSYF